MPAKPNVRGCCAGAGRRAGNSRAARTDADKAIEDSQAEVNDVSAVLSTPGAAAGESAGRMERPSLPEALLQRRLDKERIEKGKAFKEKETMQKKMDEMQAQLDLAHSKVGDVVSVESPITPSAGKVRLKLL
jgi:hypothetical protein